MNETVVQMKSHMALWAFRYTLGRMTYAPSMVQEEIMRVWDSLDYETRETISRDLAEEINRDAYMRDKYGEDRGSLGMEMDRRGWLRFRDWISEKEASVNP